ncbi:hypothetical protein OL548_12100 [Lysinibacillus sp. MHQ-1]|nr:hypothetical protein OL548_12100 [Lysinibacillus sp. MHQ-1]
MKKKIENALEVHVALVELADDIQFEMAMQGLFYSRHYYRRQPCK